MSPVKSLQSKGCNRIFGSTWVSAHVTHGSNDTYTSDRVTTKPSAVKSIMYPWGSGFDLGVLRAFIIRISGERARARRSSTRNKGGWHVNGLETHG